MEPDFSLLSSELNLPPGCSLEEFKSAYRRRIAELHPDKSKQGPLSPSDAAALPALISTYDEVNRFYRRYGRMPGAAPRAQPGEPARQGSATPSGFRVAIPRSPSPQENQPAVRTTLRRVLAFVALILLLATWDWLTLRM